MVLCNSVEKHKDTCSPDLYYVCNSPAHARRGPIKFAGHVMCLKRLIFYNIQVFSAVSFVKAKVPVNVIPTYSDSMIKV